jgi:hydroxypyruvate isomerase
MPQFAANLTMMFNEHEFLDRFDAAADAGFEAVEFLFPYEVSAESVAERVRRNNLTVALFNMPPGNWSAGDRGIAALPTRFAELKEGVSRALEYATATGVGRLHLMAGIAPADDPAARNAYRDAVEYTAGELRQYDLDLVLEPINGRDMPGYFLNSFDRAEQLINELGLPNVKLQFDLYHRQIMHGDLSIALRRLMPIIGHIQVASVPGRHEPDGEELNWPFLFDELDRLGYAGFVGCEYRPRGATLDGLGWFKPFAATRDGTRA